MPEQEPVAFSAQGREVIAKYFPQAMKDGEIDFHRLISLLGGTPEEEPFRFCWHGKSSAKRLEEAPSACALVPCPQESEAWATTENLYIEGDNLEALKLLQPEFSHKIRMIYIDPPYNTGNDFAYRDDYRESRGSYTEHTAGNDAGRYHTNWLNLMYPRLLLARRLLSPDGVIFISIDDYELSHLKQICSEIFGEENYMNLITVKTKTSSGVSGGGEDRRLKKNTEYLLIYAFDRRKARLDPPREQIRISDYIRGHRENGTGFYYTRILEELGEKTLLCESGGLRVFTHRNFRFSTVSEKMKTEGLTADEAYAKYFDRIFMVTNAQTSLLKKVNGITAGERTLVSYDYVPRTGRSKGKPAVKYVWNRTLIVWLADSAVKENGTVYKTCVPGTLWDDISWGRLDLQGGVPFKNGKKPLKLLERLLQMTADKNAIVLDFFSGSATTAHAVMAQNARDGGTRRFIMVQIPESCEKDPAACRAGFRDICEIGRARLRLAGGKIRSGLPAGQKAPDLGFRVYRIARKEDPAEEPTEEPADETVWKRKEGQKMRRKDRQVNDMTELEGIIRRCDVCRLALADNQVPYVVPLNFGYELQNGTLFLYFHCAGAGRKLEIIKRNPLACFEMDCNHVLQEGEQACEYSMAFESIIGTGKVEFVENTEEKKDALNRIMEKYTGKADFNYQDAMLSAVTVLKLTAAEWTGKRKS